MAAGFEPQIERVLMTGDAVGGVWTFTLELAEGLAQHGIEVVLAVMGSAPSGGQLAEASAIRNLCILGSSFKLEWMEDPWADVEESGRWLMKIEGEYNPDVIHLNSFGHGALPWRAPTVLTAHSCVLSWWNAVKGESAPSSWNRYRTEVARSLHSANVVTTPSVEMASALTCHYGLPKAGCRVIPNGRSAGKFWGAIKEPFILTGGRIWDDAKNIAAIARIARALPWPVYIAGDSRVTHFEGCHMLGYLSAPVLADWYARAAVYALPARYEPFGLSALEAALSGCALVLGDISSLREVWEDAALFVPPDDSEACRKALERLTGDKALREEMSRAAHRRALTFDPSRMSREYLDSYRNAARSKHCTS